jgi:hypothetical protein
MMKDVGRVLGTQITDRGQLLEMIVAAENGNRESLKEEKGYRLLAAGSNGRLARITLDSRQRLLDIW